MQKVIVSGRNEFLKYVPLLSQNVSGYEFVPWLDSPFNDKNVNPFEGCNGIILFHIGDAYYEHESVMFLKTVKGLYQSCNQKPWIITVSSWWGTVLANFQNETNAECIYTSEHNIIPKVLNQITAIKAKQDKANQLLKDFVQKVNEDQI